MWALVPTSRASDYDILRCSPLLNCTASSTAEHGAYTYQSSFSKAEGHHKEATSWSDRAGVLHQLGGRVETCGREGRLGILQAWQGLKRVGDDISTSWAVLMVLFRCSPAKPSRPARAYLHLTKQECLSSLSDKVQETQFSDAKGSGGDPALLGPPTVEFGTYGRVPNSKVRKDARQGTIDQDSEFIDFLESLTNPTPKPSLTEGGSDTETKKEEVKVTPLVQYIKDKKANKTKEAAAAVKAIKHNRNDSKENKMSQGSEKKASPKDTRDTTTPVDKRSASAIRVEKIARDAAKVLIKQANTSNKIPNASPAAASTAPMVSPQRSPTPVVVTERKRERGAVSAAARIQRDLGLAGSPSGRRRRDTPASAVTPASTSNTPKQVTTPQSQNNTASPPSTTSAPASSPSSRSTPQQNITTAAPTTTATDPPTGPAANRSPSKTSNPTPPRPHQSTTSTAPRPSPAATPTATQAFLKHANPSQGITEPLLEAAFAPFGSILKVEIDKKKGFAYIDFAEPDGLQKAVAASPVKVAQGQVVVLERKVGATLQARNTRGGAVAGGTRGGQGLVMGARGVGGAPAVQGGRAGRGGRGGARGGGVGRGLGQQKAGSLVSAADVQAAAAPSTPTAEPAATPAAVTETPVKAPEVPS